MHRACLSSVAFLLAGLSPLWAVAQTIAIDSTPSRYEGSKTRDPYPIQGKEYWFGYQDCLDDQRLEFTVTLRSMARLEVWATDQTGANCLDDEADDPDCWQVFRSEGDVDGEETVPIRAQDLAAGLARPGEVRSLRAGSGTADDCRTQRGEGEEIGVSLWFMLIEGTNPIGGSEAKFNDTGLDLAGPSAPTGVSAEVGDRQLILSWSRYNDLDDVEGFVLFCVPSTDASGSVDPSLRLLGSGEGGSGTKQLGSGGSGGLGTGGLGASGGSGGTLLTGGSGGSIGGSGGFSGSPGGSGGLLTSGGSSGTKGSDNPEYTPRAGAAGGDATEEEEPATGTENADCPTGGELLTGIIPDPKYECGKAGPAATRGSTKKLENYTEYAVGVATYDQFGNAGPISAIQCGTPQLVDTFYEVYRDQRGGKGGGGYCSFSPGRNAGALGVVLMALAGLAVGRRRRA